AESIPFESNAEVQKNVNDDGTVNLHYLIPRGEMGATGPQGERGEQGPQGEKGDKGDSYALTDADKTEIKNDVSAEIEAELNTALDEIIAIQEEFMTPDGDEVEY
ncbi:MAG: hypothetical protein U0L73_02725, partial [Ruminococcus bromii]|nr:hypothetical protein [Ruminococcus bromii]